MTARAVAGPAARHAVLGVVALAVATPILWMFSTSLKPADEVAIFPPTWIPIRFEWANYVDAWRAAPFGRFFLNSAVVTVAVVGAQLANACLAAYVFACLRFPGRNLLFYIFLATMMIPGQVTLVPAYLLLKHLGWINTYWALIVPFLASGFGTFLIRQSFLGVPGELVDAARIDGASHLRILASVLVPLSRPALLTFALLSFTWRWNDFFWPLIVTNTESMRTLPIGLVMMRATEGTVQWNVAMAATVFVIAPILALFLVAQRHFVQGISRVGIKG